MDPSRRQQGSWGPAHTPLETLRTRLQELHSASGVAEKSAATTSSPSRYSRSDFYSDNRYRRRRPSESTMREGKFLSLLDDPLFSDIRILVGPEGQEFKLHRNIICLNSEFFRAACKDAFREGRAQEIKLPELSINGFDKAVKWLYGGDYNVNSSGFNPESIAEAFAAADFLGIPDLRNAILDRFCDFTIEQIDLTADSPDYVLQNPFEIIQKISQAASLSDFAALSKIMNSAVQVWVPTAEDMESWAKDDVSHNLFLTVLVSSYRKLIDEVLCNTCQWKVEKWDKKNCQACGKKFPIPRR